MREYSYESVYHDSELIERARSLFHILSNETRLRILLLLCEQNMNVTELETEIGQSQSSISHHLSLLRNNMLVTAKKSGREQYYSVTDNHVELILNISITHVMEELK